MIRLTNCIFNWLFLWEQQYHCPFISESTIDFLDISHRHSWICKRMVFVHLTRTNIWKTPTIWQRTCFVKQKRRSSCDWVIQLAVDHRVSQKTRKEIGNVIEEIVFRRQSQQVEHDNLCCRIEIEMPLEMRQSEHSIFQTMIDVNTATKSICQLCR